MRKIQIKDNEKILLTSIYIFFALIILSIIFICAIDKNFSSRYEKLLFFEKEELFPFFDEQNTIIYEGLPPYKNSKMFDKYLDTLGHGRQLVIYYEVLDGSALDIISFYQKYLIANGWSIKESYEGAETYRYNYYKGYSCLNFNMNKVDVIYSFRIYQDYFKHAIESSLRNNLPPIWYIGLMEFGEKGFSECP